MIDEILLNEWLDNIHNGTGSRMQEIKNRPEISDNPNAEFHQLAGVFQFIEILQKEIKNDNFSNNMNGFDINDFDDIGLKINKSRKIQILGDVE